MEAIFLGLGLRVAVKELKCCLGFRNIAENKCVESLDEDSGHHEKEPYHPEPLILNPKP